LTSKQLISRLLVLLVGTGIGIALLVFLLRSVNLDQLGNAFHHIDYAYLGLAVVPFLVNLLLKIPRWALLYGDDAPGWDTLFGAMNVGYAVNNLLPARLGEIVRAYWVRDRSSVGMVQSLSTVALERVCDGLALLLMLVLAAPTVAFPAKLLGPAIVIGIVFVAILIGMAFFAYSASREEHPLSRLLQRLETGRWSVIGRMARDVMVGLQALRSRRAVVLIILYTVIIWGSNAVFVWLMVRAFHIDIPLTGGVLLVAILNLGLTVPVSPGGIGVFDSLMVLILALYHVPRTPALAAALGLHVLSFAPVTIIGLIYLARTGISATADMIRTSATRSKVSSP
jgi:glycosyltransferase 2 family protein